MYVESVVRAPTVAFRTIDAKLNTDGTLSSIAVATFDPTSPRAGTYTPHPIPAPEGWTLLVSRQTGQWGTSALDSAAIVARIPMRVRRAPEVVETFTIEIRTTAAGGTLRMAWDDTVAEPDFTVR